MTAARSWIVGLVLCLAVSPGALAAQTTKPALKIARLAPLTFRGSGFQTQERVLLTLRQGRELRVVRQVRAGATGTFTARFPLLIAAEPCRSLSITAAGSQGSHALYTHRCRPGDPALP